MSKSCIKSRKVGTEKNIRAEGYRQPEKCHGGHAHYWSLLVLTQLLKLKCYSNHVCSGGGDLEKEKYTMQKGRQEKRQKTWKRCGVPGPAHITHRERYAHRFHFLLLQSYLKKNGADLVWKVTVSKNDKLPTINYFQTWLTDCEKAFSYTVVHVYSICCRSPTFFRKVSPTGTIW